MIFHRVIWWKPGKPSKTCSPKEPQQYHHCENTVQLLLHDELFCNKRQKRPQVTVSIVARDPNFTELIVWKNVSK